MSKAFEPEVLYCTAGECLGEAAVPAYATFEVDGLVGAADCERVLTFTLPLCPHHAQLLRSESRFVHFDSGQLDRDVDRDEV